MCPNGKFLNGKCTYLTKPSWPANFQDSTSCTSCSPCTVDKFRSGCDGTTEGTCEKCTEASECTRGTYLENRCTGTSSSNTAKCATCRDCPSGYYLDGCSGEFAGTCRKLTECIEGVTYQTTAPTKTTDRACSLCNTCNERGVFKNYTCQAYTGGDSTCKPLTACDNTDGAATEYEAGKPSDTSDRVCEKLTPCNYALEYRNEATPTEISNYLCYELTVCNPQFEYEVQAPTETTDRKCKTKTVFNADNDFIVSDGNGKSDRVVEPLTAPCEYPLFEEVERQMYLNRKCECCKLTTWDTSNVTGHPDCSNATLYGGNWEERLLNRLRNDSFFDNTTGEVVIRGKSEKVIQAYEERCIPKTTTINDLGFCSRGGDALNLAPAAFCGIFGTIVGLICTALIACIWIRNRRNAKKKRQLRKDLDDHKEMLDIPMAVNPMLSTKHGDKRSRSDEVNALKAQLEEQKDLMAKKNALLQKKNREIEMHDQSSQRQQRRKASSKPDRPKKEFGQGGGHE